MHVLAGFAISVVIVIIFAMTKASWGFVQVESFCVSQLDPPLLDGCLIGLSVGIIRELD